MNKNENENYEKILGGKVLASGGYGCVFMPALKCENKKREKSKISKLMTEHNAIDEYNKINNIKKKLQNIKNYKNYFLLYDITLCKPSKLTKKDLKNFTKKCSALPKYNITKKNINNHLKNLLSLNMPNGGVTVYEYIYYEGSYNKLYNMNNSLIKLLKRAIIPMNEKNIYHSDIKDVNVLVDHSKTNLYTRLIDWGLTVEYDTNTHTNIFPKKWRNRSFQFNTPFSIILFSWKIQFF